MAILFRKVFNIREGEGLRAMLMFLYIFLVIASLLVVKPVRNSLFLTKFGAEQLPYAFMLVALFAAIISTVYAGFSNKMRLDTLIYYTLLVCILCLFAFWFLLQSGFQAGWFIYVIYIWVAIFGVITTSQFWLLANYTFNAREAKRLFGFIGAGAISGGIFGGYLTNYLAPILGTENLFFICIVFLAVCIFVARVVWKRSAWFSYQGKMIEKRKRNTSYAKNATGALALILKSSHLKYTAALIGVSVIVANLVDYQFSAIAASEIENEDELTSFFGFWLSNLSISSLLIQLFLTSRVLKTFGVGASLFFLPLGILLGAIIILLTPVLWAAVLIRVSDGAFKQSINKAGLELLMLPIPKQIKDRTKAFIDVFVDSLATGIGGALLIVATAILGLSTGQISLVIISLIAVWIYIIYRVRLEYINSFRLAIEKRTIEIDEPDINLNDSNVFDNIKKILSGSNERQLLYILGLLENIVDVRLGPYLEKLLEHHSAEVKSKSLKILRSYREVDVTSAAQELAHHHDEEVRVQAIRYLCNRADDKARILEKYLNSGDHTVRTAALLGAARQSSEDREFGKALSLKKYFDEIWAGLRHVQNEEAEFLKISAARVCGIARNKNLYSYLHILLNDKSQEVVKAAIESAGKVRATVFAPKLISYLKDNTYRKYAREALASYHEEIVSTLAESLINPEQDYTVRTAIPRILGSIQSQSAVNTLLENLNQRNLFLRSEIIKALNRLKMQNPVLKYDKESIDSRILDETDGYYKLVSHLHAQNGHTLDGEKNTEARNAKTENVQRARRLLIQALEERIEANLERIFRLLGLKYVPEDMLNAFQGVKSQKSELRANAIEFLDNVLDSNLKKFIIPLVESDSPFSLIEKSPSPAHPGIADNHDCLDALLNGDDSWLRICALYLLAEEGNGKCGSEIAKFMNDTDPVVQETASFAMKKLGLVN